MSTDPAKITKIHAHGGIFIVFFHELLTILWIIVIIIDDFCNYYRIIELLTNYWRFLEVSSNCRFWELFDDFWHEFWIRFLITIFELYFQAVTALRVWVGVFLILIFHSNSTFWARDPFRSSESQLSLKNKVSETIQPSKCCSEKTKNWSKMSIQNRFKNPSL